MKTSLYRGLLAVSLAALTTQSAFSQGPVGSITNEVAGYTNALYDATLIPLQVIEMELDEGDSDLLITYAAPFTQDGKGKLAGSGPTQIAMTNGIDIALSFPGTYESKGTVKGNNGLTSFKFASKATGTAFVEDADRTLTASAKYLVTIDTQAGMLTGVAMEKATASGLGTLAGTRTFTEAIPSELGDGSWTLVINFGEPTLPKLNGTATVTLATGKVYPFNFKGTYVASKGQSKLSLTGVGDAAGSKVTVTLQDNTVTTIKGKIAGQIVSLQ